MNEEVAPATDYKTLLFSRRPGIHRLSDGISIKPLPCTTLARKTKDIAGANFKYGYSYEEAAALIRNFVPA